MHTGTESAHRLLELLITKALVTGNGRTATVRLTAEDLQPHIGPDSIQLQDLVIKISTKWDNENE